MNANVPSDARGGKTLSAFRRLTKVIIVLGVLFISGTLLVVVPFQFRFHQPAALNPYDTASDGGQRVKSGNGKVTSASRTSSEKLPLEWTKKADSNVNESRKSAASDWKEKTAASDSKEKTAVFLLSHGRSGSTLAAKLFFATTQIFYLDEPLVTFAGERSEKRANVALRALTQCEFPTIGRGKRDLGMQFVSWQRHRLVDYSQRLPPWMQQRYLKKKTVVDFRNRTLFLEDEKGRANARWLRHLMTNYCLMSEMTGMKEIRLNNDPKEPSAFSSFEFLLSGHSQVKIVHLIRHPYEVYASAQKLGWGKAQKKRQNKNAPHSTKLDDICASMAKDLEIGRRRKGAYMTVRYQDLVTKPFETVQKVHRFMGVRRGTNVQELVVETGKTAVANETLIREDITKFFSDSGAAVGAEDVSTNASRKEAFGTTRKPVHCTAECDASVQRHFGSHRPLSGRRGQPDASLL